MASVDSAQIRNLVLMSHGGTGKTSLVEALAFATGAISRRGRVEDGNTVADFDPDEQRRGMSINTAIVSLEYEGRRINLIDTPGYADFVGEMISGASAADLALILIDAAAGVQVGSDTAWQLAERRGMPRVVVVSRMDRENANWEETVAGIQASLGRQCQPLFLPSGAEASFDGVVDVLAGKAYRADGREPSAIPEDMTAAVAEAREA
ncbi:MAG: GTP-binding protein, partial [Dehalococcoidia bacterium]